MQSFSREIEGIERTPTAELMANDLLADLKEATEAGKDAPLPAIYFGSTQYRHFVLKVYYADRNQNGFFRLHSRFVGTDSVGNHGVQHEDHGQMVETLACGRWTRIEFSGFEFTGPHDYGDAPSREPFADPIEAGEQLGFFSALLMEEGRLGEEDFRPGLDYLHNVVAAH